MADTRLRRSMLITPGNRPERLRKAAATGADCLVFDLVAPAERLLRRVWLVHERGGSARAFSSPATARNDS